MYAGYSLLYQRGFLKVNDFKSSSSVAAPAHSWTERLFLIQLPKSPDILEAPANVLLEVDAPLYAISWFKGMKNCLMMMCPKYIQADILIHTCALMRTPMTYVHFVIK